MEEIPITEVWFVDIEKYVYDTLTTYVPLLQKGTSVIMRKHFNVFKEQKPFIHPHYIWGNTNSIWIRSELFQIDIFADNMQEWKNIKDIVVDLFNRRNFKWIKSKLVRTWPDESDEKTGLFSCNMDFDFVFKDMKY